jgi:serpin B
MTKTTVENDFATHLYQQLSNTKVGQNLLLSPFSIQVALAMCAVGAKGETRRVMADLIGAPQSVDEQNRQYAEMLKTVKGEAEQPFQLVTANALWGQQGYRFNPDYQKAIANCYDGTFKEVNFLLVRQGKAVKTINAWVSDKTGGKIKDLIRPDLIDQDTRLILTNAIYFKGKWQEEFKTETTRDEDWHGPNGVRKVPMMHQKGSYLYYQSDDFQALDLPYKGAHLSMLVVLPWNKDGLSFLETKWAVKGMYRLVTNWLRHEETVIVSLPRFKMETAFKLKPVLCSLGAHLAFSDNADFSGIGDEPLKISEVVHKAFVEVNEEGTEAAAATGVVGMRCASVMPTQPKVFKADHPFLFFIRDRKTNTVLFSGRVLDPK